MLLRQHQKPLAQVHGDVDFAAAPPEQEQTPERREELRSIGHLLAQLLGSRVGLLHLGGPPALDRHERTTESDLERDLLLSQFGSVGLRPQQIERLCQMDNRLTRGAPPGRDLPRPVQILDRSTDVAPLLEVHRQLRGHFGGAPAQGGLQPLSDPAVKLHAASRRDALVHNLPIERMAEAVASGHCAIRPVARSRAERGTTRGGPGQRSRIRPRRRPCRRPPPRRRQRTRLRRRSPTPRLDARQEGDGRAGGRSSGERPRGSRRRGGLGSRPSPTRHRAGRARPP